MRQVKLVSNSAESQLAEATSLFEAVERAARDYEHHQGHSDDLLRSAIAELYSFGEMLQSQASEPGTSLVEEFIKSRGARWNAAARRRPYIALVKLAFPRSASSQSQYAAVLSYASNSRVEPSAFDQWLQEGGGIKGRYPEAADYFGSATRQRNSQARTSRIKAGKQKLLERDHSVAIALPTGVSAPEGFALVLAKVEADGKAAIIDVIETAETELEPIFLRYAPSKATAKSILASEALGQMYRAIDLVLGCTGDAVQGVERQILVFNTLDRGRPVCRIEAISEAYTYAWAGMVLSNHLDGLPTGIPFILPRDDAAYFRSEFANHTGWTIRADERPRIEADQLRTPIELRMFEPTVRYRTSQPPAGHRKPFSATHSDQLQVQQFLRDRRADHERLNARRKEQQVFPSALKIQSQGGKLEIALPKLPTLTSILGTSSPDRDLSHLELDMGDVERAIGALAPYETTVDGSFVDFEVDDAALCFQAHFDDDVLTVVLPTKSGTDYNQSCMDLDLLATG